MPVLQMIASAEGFSTVLSECQTHIHTRLYTHVHPYERGGTVVLPVHVAVVREDVWPNVVHEMSYGYDDQ